MKLIFLTLARMEGIESRGIYSDLMRKFRDEGHSVYIVTPSERKCGKKTQLLEVDGVHILRVRTLNIQKTNIIEKGLGTLLIEWQYKRAIKKHLKGVKFDLITYSTPPITLTNVVKYLKRENPEAISYLQLKDIFPQNAVDVGMFPEDSFIHRYFRRKEIQLYKNSDYIGCMSPANVEFVRQHNPYYPEDHVEVAPNSIELSHTEEIHRQAQDDKETIRIKYGLPTDIPIFIYGGNLGKPQGIDFLIKCLDSNKSRDDCFFLIIGSGTEYPKLEKWYEDNDNKSKYRKERFHVKVMKSLPKEDYDRLVRACEVGLIFLDHRFTIPNYPSRLLSYLENKMPVICATDVNTDIGRIAEENGYGYWCESKNTIDFTVLVNKFMAHPERIREMGERGYEFLKQNYLVEHTYQAIMKHLPSKSPDASNDESGPVL